jgi:hypothetical protein
VRAAAARSAPLTAGAGAHVERRLQRLLRRALPLPQAEARAERRAGQRGYEHDDAAAAMARARRSAHVTHPARIIGPHEDLHCRRVRSDPRRGRLPACRCCAAVATATPARHDDARAAWRPASVLLFVCLLVAYRLGWIHLTGLPLGR